MPQSLSKVIIHIIFSTKYREPWQARDVRPRMHAYVATICRDLDAEALRVGGVADHIHVVTTPPRTLSQAAMVETLKKTSSKWIKQLDSKYRQFYWQRGYSAFSVSRVSLMRFSNTWRVRKSTIAPAVFKRSIEIFCASTESNSTNAMSGIEANDALDSRFQRSFLGKQLFPGALPQA